MKNLPTREEAFASQNFDPTAVKVEGVPPQHIQAVLGFINLCVAHDAVNPEFNPDYNNYGQPKYENYHVQGSPSGVGFAFDGTVRWTTHSHVGARLVSESRDKAKHLSTICHEDYKQMKVYDREIK